MLLSPTTSSDMSPFLSDRFIRLSLLHLCLCLCLCLSFYVSVRPPVHLSLSRLAASSHSTDKQKWDGKEKTFFLTARQDPRREHHITRTCLRQQHLHRLSCTTRALHTACTRRSRCRGADRKKKLGVTGEGGGGHPASQPRQPGTSCRRHLKRCPAALRDERDAASI